MENARSRVALSEDRGHRLVLSQEAVGCLFQTQLPAGCVALDGSVRPEDFLVKKYSGMALATVRAIVAAAAVLIAQSGSASASGSTEVSCTIGGATVVQKVTTPGTSLKVLCKKSGGDAYESAPQVCADPQCKTAKPEQLKVACPGGSTATVPGEKNALSVNCPQLPNAEATVILLCGALAPGPQQKNAVCAVELQVSPPPPQGPQICAAAGATTTLAIHGERGQTQFACASSGLTALHPSTTGKVFKENCTSEEDLEDLKLTTGPTYKILAATRKPRTRKLCYVCRKVAEDTKANEECKIIIDVSAGSGLFERTALNLACSLVLTLFQLR